MNAMIIGRPPSQTLQNALNRLNIRMVRWLAGDNVVLFPTAIAPEINVVIILEDFSSPKLARCARQRAERRSIPVLRCFPSVSALAAAWSAAFRGPALV